MARRCFCVLVAWLVANIELVEGCDFYCCAGNRTAFVEAGWWNCCLEEQCAETLKRPIDEKKLAETRREYYRPQSCNVQCCRETPRTSTVNCCPDRVCNALATLDSDIRDELFAQDLTQNMQQLRGLDWPVTESWIRFAKESVPEESAVYPAGSRIQQLLNSGIFSAFDTTTVTENPEERRRQKEIADAQARKKQAEEAQAEWQKTILYGLLAVVCIVIFVTGTVWRCRRHFQISRLIENANNPQPVYFTGEDPAATSLLGVVVVPAGQRSPAQYNVAPTNDHPPSYHEATEPAEKNDVLPKKR
ncbi:hypothetical protein RvY_15030 [Ramazzottius varieornatus]|uniref:Uncharacterized protein n=1 Tax=Ramazzottius varieornatus TaxID=947166 RepID=A0A1D1VTC8_RAMVA|nr:hypothetical protein RvY_15030 [Ramazzottius varieornatus]